MKLVRPGIEATQPLHLDAAAAQRLRVGRIAGALLAAGWLLTPALAFAFGPRPDASGTSLAPAAGVRLGPAPRSVGREPRPGRPRHGGGAGPPPLGPPARALAARPPRR